MNKQLKYFVIKSVNENKREPLMSGHWNGISLWSDNRPQKKNVKGFTVITLWNLQFDFAMYSSNMHFTCTFFQIFAILFLKSTLQKANFYKRKH